MSEAARVRETIDLEEFERRLREAAMDQRPARASRPAGAPPPFIAEARAAAAAQSPEAPFRVPVQAPASDVRFAAAEPSHFESPRFEPPPEPHSRRSAARAFDDAPRFEPPPASRPRQGAPRRPEEAPPGSPPHWRPIHTSEQEAEARRRRRRKMLLAAAGVVLIAGGGAAFTMTSGGTSGDAPTVRASSEPFKIQPPQKPATEKASETASILDRNGSERIAASRVVTREEQPVDVREAARQTRAAEPQGVATTRPQPSPTTGAPPSSLPTAGPAANSFFPEPRRVRTVAVRPDGSIISDAPAAPLAPAPPPPALRSGASSTASAQPPAASSGAVPPPPVPRAASPAPAPSPPPARTAAAPSSVPSGSTGGGFAVQLGAPGSDAEAKGLIARVQQRHGAALAGYQPTVRRASVDGREVYRVRVVGLSQTEANGLCDRLKATGGNCFVARD